MAIKMVREPSEAPNIRNIDDIIGLRYAYGNQDGYVIGKGNELDHTINGSIFTIKSGRVVLQGVESDIDANGLSISVDNVAEMRYFAVYYKVNLTTNTTSIESTYDTVSFPNISTGDDLTKNANGIANLVLYHFTAQNGAIQNIEKIVKPISYVNSEYIKDIKVNNAAKINDVAITQNSSGVLNVGEAIILQKKLVWQGEIQLGRGYYNGTVIDIPSIANNPVGFTIVGRVSSNRWETTTSFQFDMRQTSSNFYGTKYGGTAEFFAENHLTGTSNNIYLYLCHIYGCRNLDLSGYTLNSLRFYHNNLALDFKNLTVTNDDSSNFRVYITQIFELIE